MIQVKEFADELVDSVPGFHLYIHCKKECKKKLKQENSYSEHFLGGLLHRASP